MSAIHKELGITPEMGFALCVAAQRPGRTICPVKTGRGKLYGDTETQMLSALERRGLLFYDGCVPIISDAGLEVVRQLYNSLPTDIEADRKAIGDWAP